MSKRIFVLFVAVVLIFSFTVSGCRQSDGATTTTATTTRATTRATTTAGTTAVTTTAATEPTEITYDNVITVKAFLRGYGNVIFEGTDRQKEYEERFGIRIEPEFAWGTEHSEKFNLMLAANNLPDYFSGLFSSDYLIAGDRGQWVNYLDHLDQMPNVLKLFNNPSALNAASTQVSPEGGVYGLWLYYDFSKTNDVSISYSFFVRDDLLENGGFDLDKDLNDWDDLIRMLEILKEQNDNKPIIAGVGSSLPTTASITMFAPYMGTSASALYWNYEEQVWEGSFYRENHKDYIKFLSWLFKEGMLHPDLGKQSHSDVDVLGLAGDIALSYFHGTYATLYSEDKTYEWVPVAPPAYKGKLWYGVNGMATNFYINQGQTINKGSIDPDTIPRMLRFVDWLYSDEARFILFGEEGEDYMRIDGFDHLTDYPWLALTDRFIDELPEEYKQYAKPYEEFLDNRPHLWSTFYIYDWLSYLDNWWALGKHWSPWSVTKTEKLADFYGKWEDSRVALPPPLATIPELNDERADLLTTCNTFIEETLSRAIIGRLDIDAEWDNIISALKSMGYDRLIEIENIRLAQTESTKEKVQKMIQEVISR